MKRILTLLTLSILTLSGCQKEENDYKIWEIYPIMATIVVTDSNGNDLLNPKTTNAIDLSKIEAVYKDKTYQCIPDKWSPPKMVNSKVCPPDFYGLKSEFNNYLQCNLLRFGELEGAQNYQNESVTIVWPDGSTDKISFNRDVKFISNSKGHEIKQEWFLNGVKQPTNKPIIIIK